MLVLQVGARLHYAVPAVYAGAQALHSLYTDATASSGILSLARRAIPLRLRTASARRLLGRTVPAEVPAQLIRSETLSTLTERAGLRLARRSGALVSTHERLRARILREGFGGANCLYVLSNSDLGLMQTARDAGLAVLYEQITPPTIGRILREERKLFPGIEKQVPEEVVEQGIARDIRVFQLADVVVCPSTHVREQVRSLGGPSVRTRLVPYGINQEWLQVPRSPVRGRILFVGNVGLGKGSHYLAEATRILKGRGVRCDVRVVGPLVPGIVRRREFQGPTYVGQIPRDIVRAEFGRADVFVLPSLAEGCPIAHLEALACGLPVVTTPNCGSQVRDGEEGFIVPIRDPHALADRLEQIITDRPLRERMSQAALARARQLSWEHFGEGLLDTTREAMRAAAARRNAHLQAEQEKPSHT